MQKEDITPLICMPEFVVVLIFLLIANNKPLHQNKNTDVGTLNVTLSS